SSDVCSSDLGGFLPVRHSRKAKNGFCSTAELLILVALLIGGEAWNRLFVVCWILSAIFIRSAKVCLPVWRIRVKTRMCYLLPAPIRALTRICSPVPIPVICLSAAMPAILFPLTVTKPAVCPHPFDPPRADGAR